MKVTKEPWAMMGLTLGMRTLSSSIIVPYTLSMLQRGVLLQIPNSLLSEKPLVRLMKLRTVSALVCLFILLYPDSPVPFCLVSLRSILGCHFLVSLAFCRNSDIVICDCLKFPLRTIRNVCSLRYTLHMQTQ